MRTDQKAPLGPGDLELLATAAFLLGRNAECIKTLERAHQAYLDDDEVLPAAHCAFWLGFNLAGQGELGPATGWLGRAGRLVERDGRDCVERGYLLLPDIVMKRLGGDYAGAREGAEAAREIGVRFSEADLVAYALHEQGRALVGSGRVNEGIALLDEAMVAVIAGEISPLITGLIYCSVIEGCREVFEFRRALEWTKALTRWCAGQQGMVTFTGQCMVHWAQILNLRGEWQSALEEAQRAAERFARGVDRQAAGAAFYEQAEVYRLRGEIDLAEESYRKAGEWGMEPQPGLALLRLAQGRVEDAVAAIRRALSETTERPSRARLLLAHVEISLASGDTTSAYEACRELEAISRELGTSVIGALAASARGAVALADERPVDALRDLRRAWRIWQEMEAPYEAARTRVLLAKACRALGDEDTARLELEAARSVFEQLGAAPDLAGTHPTSETGAAGLTPRELEVLRLIAVGATNKAIAARLVVSERTVDRHVSNILAKVGASSRTAATAYAYRHKLI